MTRLLVLVKDQEEARLARKVGASAATSLQDPAIEAEFGSLRRIAADDLADASAPDGATILLDATPDRLLEAVPFPDLARFAAASREHGTALALAGRLEAPDIPRLLPLAPSFLVFDAPARDEAGGLDIRALAELVALLDEPAPASPFAGEPDRVFVRDLVEEMEVGAYASERGRRQRVRFSVEAELAPVPGSRTTADIYSYDRMMDAIRALARRAPEPFVETLAETLASELLDDRRLQAVTVRVEKLDLGPSAAGVQIRRTRQG